MYVAGDPSPGLVALTCLGGYLSAGGAGAVNHWFDRDIDAQMKRTASRPIPSGRVAPRSALIVRVRCSRACRCSSSRWRSTRSPPRCRSRGFLGYVLVYTVWLKRRTPQNIVIGGAAGAVPPLVGWAAVTGSVSGTAVILFFIVFFWTPPHFWALSLLMKEEYAQGRRADAARRARRGRDAPPDPALLGAAVRGHAAALLRRRLRRRSTWSPRSCSGSASSRAPCACSAAPTGAARCACTSTRSRTWRCCSARWSPTPTCRIRAADADPPARAQEHPHRPDRRRRSACSCSASRS